MSDLGKPLEWDAELSAEAGGFEVVPEGFYDFEVIDIARKWYKGGKKMCPCNQVDVKMLISKDGQKAGTLTQSLYLNEKCEGILASFFGSIGVKKHGEPLKMDWGKAKTGRGKCKVTVSDYTKSDGTTIKTNDVQFRQPDTASTQKGNDVPF